MMMTGFGIFGVLLYLFFLGCGVYAFILFVKLATRGIRALDLYIADKIEQRNSRF
ncbi:hypothetical protein [Paenibacillus sp. NPDC057934]|uniref:hypothetical protein n=1 Tax=Paenibacillus sp. NPDC057934 TaxID=3346282 RepID=UPI0036DA6083